MTPRKPCARRTCILKSGNWLVRMDKPMIMGIVNTTTDSFSGDGLGDDLVEAATRGSSMFKSGADFIDIGGESTRPGAAPIPENVEISHTVGVVRALAVNHPGRVSIDTYKPEVARRALSAGATIVNDVTGLRNPEMIEAVAETGASVIIMHMRGEPRTMQKSPRYKNVVSDIFRFLADRIDAAERRGVDPRRIMVDPGIGFGKTVNHNLEIIARLREFRDLGKPIVIGVSRKSFIGSITGLPADERLEGSIAAAVLAVNNGANVVRVHDVEQTFRVLKVFNAINSKKRE